MPHTEKSRSDEERIEHENARRLLVLRYEDWIRNTFPEATQTQGSDAANRVSRWSYPISPCGSVLVSFEIGEDAEKRSVWVRTCLHVGQNRTHVVGQFPELLPGRALFDLWLFERIERQPIVDRIQIWECEKHIAERQASIDICAEAKRLLVKTQR